MADQTPQSLTSLGTHENVRFIDAIIDEMETGYFFNSARLVDLVLRDARLFSVLMTRISGLLGRELDFEPAKDTAKGRMIRDGIEECWDETFPHSTLVQLLGWGIMHNTGLARIAEEADPWSLEIWHPFALRWDEFRRCYLLQTRERSEFELIRGDDGTFSDDTGTRWLLYTPYGYGNTRSGALRCVHRLFLERQWSHRDRARYSEIFGQPIRFGVAPLLSTEAQRNSFRDKLLPVGAESVVIGEQGEEGNKWDLKLVEASGASTDLFDREIAQLDKEIATLLLGQSQSTDGQAGLGSNDKAGETVRLDVLRHDDETLSPTLRMQFLVPYCQFAYGSDLAPWTCYDVEPPEDTKSKAEEFKAVMEGLQIAKANNIPVDEREVLEAFSIPALSEEDQAALDAEAAAQAAQQQQAKPQPNGAVSMPPSADMTLPMKPQPVT